MTQGYWPLIRSTIEGYVWQPAGAMFIVEGTVYPGAPAPPSCVTADGNGYWCGFASGVVGGLINCQDGLWLSNMIGYPAQTFPMGPSVQAGRQNLNAALVAYSTMYQAQHGSLEGMAITFSGWSQGAMVVGQTLWNDIFATGGSLAYLAPYIYRAYLFGDPYRCPGIAHGNELIGQALPPNVDGDVTGGIGGSQCYTVAQANTKAPDGKYLVNSFVNPGDMYADCPVGSNPWTAEAKTGAVETQIYNIVQQATVLDVISVAKDLGRPVATIEGIFNTLKFFSAGTNAPHFQYQSAMIGAINDALSLGNSLPHMGSSPV